MIHTDPRGWIDQRQAELLTERVEGRTIECRVLKDTGFDYEVTAQIPMHDARAFMAGNPTWTRQEVRTVYVSQDDATQAYKDAMLDHAEMLADAADTANDQAKEAAWDGVCEGRR